MKDVFTFAYSNKKISLTKEMIEDDLYGFFSPLKIHSKVQAVEDVIDFHERIETDGHMPIIFPSLEARPSDGKYQAEIIHVEYKRSLKENPMIAVEYELIGLPKEQFVKSYHVVRESGIVDWTQLLEACGFFGFKLTDAFEIRALIGSRLQIVIEHGWVRHFYPS